MSKRRKLAESEDYEQFRVVWDDMDTKKLGAVSIGQFDKFLKTLDPHMDKNELRNLISNMNSENHGNGIDFNHFAKFMSSGKVSLPVEKYPHLKLI